ncbi:anthranilate phosphoribosyltransferase [Longibacter salinarum]|uniref:Anthranilate phosphoribosyltransferase n=1 Tax=Longibacter salinarum TaxID=1850348 RepID=A0A2A8CW98_9BACT|nr:anthranilate phosphoribosyltransferase [Longibacter salinarum]PEN12893.1 anthranilate phosphoribosyltransferase [Longibacter salinarum]
MKEYLNAIADGHPLTREQAESAMRIMMTGDALPEHVAALLMGLRARGEQLDELVGFTKVMREFAISVDVDDPHTIDLCGTGGDGASTFNISTTAAIIAAGAGATVAKHGNRSVSSKSGSADVLEHLGVEIELQKAGVEHCLDEVGIAFLFAPYFHPAMRHVMPVRKSLGVRTFFNILGPLCNPAGVKRQLVGAFNTKTAQMMVRILSHLDAEHVVTLHAQDGLDEVSVSASTTVFEYDNVHGDGVPRSREVGPEQHEINRAPISALAGGTAADNAAILRNILSGDDKGPRRHVAVLNAAYALQTSGKFEDIDACIEAANDSIDSGNASRTLDRLIEVSQDAPKG